jgi:hypothetical protein
LCGAAITGLLIRPTAPAPHSSHWGRFCDRCQRLHSSRFSFRFPQRFHRTAIKFLYGIYKEAPELGSRSYAAIRISLRSGILKRPWPRRRCVSSWDVLDLLGYVLVAVFQRPFGSRRTLRIRTLAITDTLRRCHVNFHIDPKTIEQPNEQMEHA